MVKVVAFHHHVIDINALAVIGAAITVVIRVLFALLEILGSLYTWTAYLSQLVVIFLILLDASTMRS
ncbi:hypothetical protein ACPSKX_07955 [Moritella viscosa]